MAWGQRKAHVRDAEDIPGKRQRDDLLELARSYQPACILVAAAEIEFFDVLPGGDHTAVAVAAKSGADVRAATIVLDALAGLAIIEKLGPSYRLPA